MMFVLDTNVLSELMNPAGEKLVVEWADNMKKAELFTTAINQAEVLFGLAVMPKGRKRTSRIECADAMFKDDFGGRILPFDEYAAFHFAEIAAMRQQAGHRIDAVDAQIAAIARAHGMAIVTRNVKHFENCGIDVFNPWSREVE
jgi:predicted nucleic acid-binding protein